MKAYEGIFEVIPDAVLVVDPDGTIVRANAQSARLFGFGGDELVGIPVESLIPQRFAARHAAHRARYVANPRVRPMARDSTCLRAARTAANSRSTSCSARSKPRAGR